MSNISLVRLKREYDFLLKDPSENFVAYPIKDDLFCWHFTIKGPEGTEFEGGLYHGVIKLPNSYPNKPPNLMFLTPSGRFDINMDICLSVTKYHREEWQAAWTIRSMLEALVAFLPIKEDHDAIGAIDYPADVRKKYAILSRKFKCENCGPIVNLIPEKKKSETKINNEIADEVEISKPLNAQDGSLNNVENEKEADEISDLSNPKVDSQHTQIKPRLPGEKIQIANKQKKPEHEKKHTIEGVIIEASNEDDMEDELAKNLHRQQTFERNNNNKEIELSTTDVNQLKGNQRENLLNKESFAEYFKKLRQMQYENLEGNTEPKVKENESQAQPGQKVTTSKMEDINSPQPRPGLNQTSATSTTHNLIKSQMEEEIEFLNVSKSIKFHKSKNKEEIINELLNDEMTDKDINMQSESTYDFIKAFQNSTTSKESNATTLGLDNKHLTSKDYLLLTNQHDKLEDLLKKRVNVMKYLSRKAYMNTKAKRNRIMIYLMLTLIALIFAGFYYVRNYLYPN